jgi:hypothetical protein
MNKTKNLKNMKRNFKNLTIVALLVIAPLLMFAQGPPTDPPHPGGDPTTGGGTPVGASVGDGVFILLTLAVAYAGRKWYVMRTKTAEEA